MTIPKYVANCLVTRNNCGQLLASVMIRRNRRACWLKLALFPRSRLHLPALPVLHAPSPAKQSVTNRPPCLLPPVPLLPPFAPFALITT